MKNNIAKALLVVLLVGQGSLFANEGISWIKRGKDAVNGLISSVSVPTVDTCKKFVNDHKVALGVTAAAATILVAYLVWKKTHQEQDNKSVEFDY